MKNHVIVNIQEASAWLVESLKAGGVTVGVSSAVPMGRYLWWDHLGNSHICNVQYEERKAG